MSRLCVLSVVAVLSLFSQLNGRPLIAQTEDTRPLTEQALWTAARRGELDRLKEAIGSGVDVNSKTDYGATALSFAADRGHLAVVEYLLAQDADPNVKDSFYNATPMTWAGMRGNYGILKALVLAGGQDVDTALAKAIGEEDFELIRFVTERNNATRTGLKSCIKLAESKELSEIEKLLQASLDRRFPKIEIPQSTLDSYLGIYQASPENRLTISAQDGSLTATSATGTKFVLDADSVSVFSNSNATLAFDVDADRVTGIKWTLGGTEQVFEKLSEADIAALPKRETALVEAAEIATGEFPASAAESMAADLAISSPNWSQFRGKGARGIADGQHPPTTWNAKSNENLAWKTPIPGLGHSCPVVWDNRLFVTTAISGQETEIKTGLYGDVTSVEDDTEHEFVTYCLNAVSGEVLWQKTACKKTPRVKRHLKSTHANSTVATDGKYVVSWFGSEGIYCYTMDGNLVWQKDLGLLDSGWFYDRDYQWQFGASPIIHSGRLILLCDIQDQSFLTTLDLATGNEIWRTQRDEIPSWSTPTVIETPTGLQIVTNATGASRGYSYSSGEELWQIERNSEIAVPTPFAARGLIFVSSGYRPIQPIYAIRLDARGDLTLDRGTDRSEYIAWSESKGGPYMPSPIVYGDYLYICSNSGILTCYQATSGKRVYKKRLEMDGTRSFVGSPIAADGHLFFTSEEGETAVVQAGPVFKTLSNNTCDENCLTTPAISRGRFYIRGQNHLFAFEMGKGQ